MMDDRSIAGTNFERLDPLVLGEVRRHLEVLVLNGPTRRYRVIFAEGENGIGLANLPAIRVLRL